MGFEHRPLRDGEQFELGEVGFEVLHTPGHTPEHISLVVYDRSASADVPAMLLSGGALLVGDLARPDLLGGRDQAEAAAREFCRTIQTKILELPDHVEVFPTHVAGSLCGGNIGSRLSTTVGYERRTNEILATVSSKDEFVEQCLRLDNLPAVPPYWRRMRRQNLAGVAALGVLREPPALGPDAVRRAALDGAVVLDTRAPEAFGGAHIPGALSVGQGASFPTWAGTVLDEDAAVVLVLDSPADLWPVTWDLLRIGYELPVGWLAGGMLAWRTAALDLERLPQITVHELRRRLAAGDARPARRPPAGRMGRRPRRGRHVHHGRRAAAAPRRRAPHRPAPGGGVRIGLPVLRIGQPPRRSHRSRPRQRPWRDERLEGGWLPDDRQLIRSPR